MSPPPTPPVQIANDQIAVPDSDVNREYYWDNQKRMLEEGTLQGYQAGGGGGAGGKMVGHSFEKLAAMSRNK